MAVCSMHVNVYGGMFHARECRQHACGVIDEECTAHTMPSLSVNFCSELKVSSLLRDIHRTCVLAMKLWANVSL
jgi:hypothetical protein